LEVTSDAEFVAYFTAQVVRLRRLAYALCDDWHLAEDLVQHTFLKLYRRWRRVSSDTLDAYARRILVNAYLTHRRDRRREQVVAEPPDRTATTADAVTSIDIGRALAALPPRRRALIVLRYLEDVSVAEAAVLLGIAEGTVKSQTAKAIQTLRAVLDSPALTKE
jgi:RNA polymerase sigma-70 factor (sigma-E family)